MKKATTKRERKYGKKDEEGFQTKKPAKREKVKLMIDGYTIMEFNTRKLAESFISKRLKESAEKNQRPASFIFL